MSPDTHAGATSSDAPADDGEATLGCSPPELVHHVEPVLDSQETQVAPIPQSRPAELERTESGEAGAGALGSSGLHGAASESVTRLAESDLRPGLVVGDYTLVRKLGEGGMGMVFLAAQRTQERLVALKVLPPRVSRDPRSIRRFEREVRALARLAHPNIVASFGSDDVCGLRLLVLEYVDGVDLAALVKRDGPLPLPKALGYLYQAARGLAYAHKRGLVHRDIKPSNLLVDGAGRVKLLDLGIARFDEAIVEGSEEAMHLTRTGLLLGTVAYMAPEQAENAKLADVRSDIYSLGKTLQYLLTGRSGFPRVDRDDEHQALVLGPAKPRSGSGRAASPSRPSAIPPAVDRVLQKMTAPRPDDRYQSVPELMADLTALSPRRTAAKRAQSAAPPDAAAHPGLFQRLAQVAKTFFRRRP
jgi:eukaryotic-like serine/threonine-protein kinase